MESIQTLGKILPDNHQQHRDAVHVAIMPVIAGEEIRSGEKLRIKYGTTDVVLTGNYNDDYIGIADPFIQDYYIKKGQKFWMWLRPGTITGLRHEWTHPAIDTSEQKPTNESEKWLREFADKWNMDYYEMVSGALEKNGWATARGQDLHSASELDEGDEELFWYHIEKIHGKKLSASHKASFSWSCTC